MDAASASRHPGPQQTQVLEEMSFAILLASKSDISCCGKPLGLIV